MPHSTIKKDPIAGSDRIFDGSDFPVTLDQAGRASGSMLDDPRNQAAGVCAADVSAWR